MRFNKNDQEFSKNADNPEFEKTKDELGFVTSLRVVADVLIHMSVAIVAFMAIIYAIKYEADYLQQLHVILTTCGYQFLMVEAVLLKSNGSSWSEVLSGKQKRTAHWILQIIGSVMAITGIIIRINLNTIQFNGHWLTLHGIFGLVAMVCTVVSLVNGLASLYAVELGGICSGLLSKLTHIFFGSATLVFACVSLCYGLDLWFFWPSTFLAQTLMFFTSMSTFLVLIRPAITFYGKTKSTFSS